MKKLKIYNISSIENQLHHRRKTKFYVTDAERMMQGKLKKFSKWIRINMVGWFKKRLFSNISASNGSTCPSKSEISFLQLFWSKP